MSKLTRVALVFLTEMLLWCVPITAQSAAEDLLRQQQKWQINCMAKGCIASVDIPRGYSDDPPDPHDVNQYVSVSVAVNWQQHQPSMLLFEVDPHADKQSGVSIDFAHTVSEGQKFKVVLSDNPAPRLPFIRCSQDECIAGFSGGPAEETACSDFIQANAVRRPSVLDVPTGRACLPHCN